MATFDFSHWPIEPYALGAETPNETGIELAAVLANTTEKLDTVACAASEIHSELALVGKLLFAVPLGPAPQMLDDAGEAQLHDVVADTLGPSLTGDERTSLVNTFLRYDEFFGTIRVDSSGSSPLAQVITTSAAVIDDLSRCMLEGNEVRSFTDGWSAAIETLCSCTGSVSRFEVPLAEEATPELPGLALRRWKLGHHAFNILVSLCTSHLNAAAAGSIDDAARTLALATRLFRASTAAMWYAEAIPRNLYIDLLRPAMVEASGKGSGFSGTDNLEFRWLNQASLSLIDRLSESFGEIADWPPDFRRLVWLFFETRHLDVEHHTLLAEKVVGSEPSLKRIRAMEQLGRRADAKDLPAVEALRRLAEPLIEAKDMLV